MKTKSLRTQEHMRLMEWLRAARHEAGRTQQYVAERLGRTQSFVSKYERGERRLDLVEVMRIAHILHFDTADAVRKLETAGRLPRECAGMRTADADAAAVYHDEPGPPDLDVAEISLNWLAHVFLSEPEVEFRLGNLLADVVKGAQRESMPVDFVRGVACHHAIDAFTDSHPVVRRSRARISPAQRRFSGVLVDVFYDYFLATHWAKYASMPLDEFTAGFYADIARSRIELPEQARAITERIMKNDLLGSYRRVEGVERSLRRLSAYLSSRWQRRFALEDGIADLRAHHDGFAADFLEFFPALRSHVDAHPSTASARGPA